MPAGARSAGAAPAEAGTLYLVAAPIGDEGDLTRRAADALCAADIIAAEDTRTAKSLVASLSASGRLVSYHEHNERTRAPWLVRQLLDGLSVALLPEAGTPLISDPGYSLVRAAIDAGVEVRPLPGPSAVLAALTGSGLSAARFTFVGFLPRQPARRRALLESFRQREETLVAFEAPHRILAALDDALDVFGDRHAVLAWNLTKPGERFLRGRLSELASEIAAWEYVHGEMTLVVERGESTRPVLFANVDEAIELLLAHGVPTRAIRDAVVAVSGAARREVYARIVAAASRRGG